MNVFVKCRFYYYSSMERPTDQQTATMKRGLPRGRGTPGRGHQYFELLFLFDAPEIFPRWTIHHRKFGMNEKDVFPLQSEKRVIMNGQVEKGGLARFSNTGTFSSRQNGLRDVKDLKLL